MLAQKRTSKIADIPQKILNFAYKWVILIENGNSIITEHFAMDAQNAYGSPQTRTDYSNLGRSSIVNGTTDREALPKHWYVAQVRSCCERKIANKINSLGLEIETFVPVQTEVHQWSDRKKKIDRILLPMHVLFYSDENTAKEVLKVSGVYSLLSAPGKKEPATIPQIQIDRFKFMIGNSESEITIMPTSLVVGDKVKVVRGSLAGLEGIIVKEPDGKAKIVISIDFLGSASVKISTKDIGLQSQSSNQN